MAGSFFVQDGYGPTLTTTLEELVTQVIADAGAIGPKSVTIVNPTGSESITLFYVNAAATVQQLTASVRGTTPSITVDVFYAPTPSDSGISILDPGGVTVTDTSITTSFSSAVIPANSYVRLVTSAKSGTVDELSISLDF